MPLTSMAGRKMAIKHQQNITKRHKIEKKKKKRENWEKQQSYCDNRNAGSLLTFLITVFVSKHQYNN